MFVSLTNKITIIMMTLFLILVVAVAVYDEYKRENNFNVLEEFEN